MVESETEIWMRIHEAAFAHGIVNQIIHKENPISEQSLQQIVAGRKAGFSDPYAVHLKVIDTDLPPDHKYNRIIACAKWLFYTEPLSDEIMAKRALVPPPIESANPEGWNAFFGTMRSASAACAQRAPHAYLGVLVTHPEHQRRGAGGMLLRYGIERAKKEGWEIWLLASTWGVGMYQKAGFEIVRRTEFDLTPWGFEGVDKTGTVFSVSCLVNSFFFRFICGLVSLRRYTDILHDRIWLSE
jgi:GNAT superfamily N-acetyltransferase